MDLLARLERRSLSSMHGEAKEHYVSERARAMIGSMNDRAKMTTKEIMRDLMICFVIACLVAVGLCAVLSLTGCKPRYYGAVPRDPGRGGGWIVVGQDEKGDPSFMWCVDLVHPSILMVTCQPLDTTIHEKPRKDGLPYLMPK